jgi:two-component system, LytTR family, response regulator
MIRVVLVDDDLYALDQLQVMLETCEADNIEIMARFQDPLLAFIYLKQHSPDILFLDIQMPGLNGFELLDQVNTNANIIFVTSFNSYAIQAIRYSAFDYLVKPINLEAIRETLTRYKKKQNKENRQDQLNILRFNLNQKQLSHFKLLLPGQKENVVLATNEITHCVADSNYTLVYLSNGKKVIASKTLGDIEQVLPASLFIRIHKSYMINTDFLSRISVNPYEVGLSNGVVLPISRRRYQELNQTFSGRIS